MTSAGQAARAGGGSRAPCGASWEGPLCSLETLREPLNLPVPVTS